ncbi:hypothetical protein RCL1_001986 [Eukaryota sp. TZLM3-RCL]
MNDTESHDESCSTPSSTTSEPLRTKLRQRMLNILPGPFNSSERQSAWLQALRIHTFDTDKYIIILQQSLQHCPHLPNIIGDVQRTGTFKTLSLPIDDIGHLSQSLTRVLSAFFSCHSQLPYVQGINMIASVLVAVLPESAAFYALEALFSNFISSFLFQNFNGVYSAISLVDRVLEFFDSNLYNHLRKSNCDSTLWCFPLVLTLLSIIPPLSEVIKLFDFFLAFRPCGPVIAILAIVSIVISNRELLLNSRDPKVVLQSLSQNSTQNFQINAELVVANMKLMIPLLPENLRSEIITCGRIVNG